MNIDLLRSIITAESYKIYSSEIQAEYKRVFKREMPSTCGDKLKDAALILYARQKELDDTRLYKLKTKYSVYDSKTRRAYNFVTITDEIAERILNEHPEWVDRFKEVPM